MPKRMFHVIAEGFHPHNTWERRSDGLYELSGSVYAFSDGQVRECTQAGHTLGACGCWKTETGHKCPREGCKG